MPRSSKIEFWRAALPLAAGATARGTVLMGATRAQAGRWAACATVAAREQIVAIEVHDLVPGRHEITHELLLRVVARVDLRQRA